MTQQEVDLQTERSRSLSPSGGQRSKVKVSHDFLSSWIIGGILINHCSKKSLTLAHLLCTLHFYLSCWCTKVGYARVLIYNWKCLPHATHPCAFLDTSVTVPGAHFHTKGRPNRVSLYVSNDRKDGFSLTEHKTYMTMTDFWRPTETRNNVRDTH